MFVPGAVCPMFFRSLFSGAWHLYLACSLFSGAWHLNLACSLFSGAWHLNLLAPESCVLLRCVAPESCCSQRIVRCGGWAIQPRRTGRKPRMPNDPRRPRRIGVVESPRGGCIRAGSNSEIAGAERGGGAALTADYFLTPIMRGAQGRQFDRSC